MRPRGQPQQVKLATPAGVSYRSGGGLTAPAGGLQPWREAYSPVGQLQQVELSTPAGGLTAPLGLLGQAML